MARDRIKANTGRCEGIKPYGSKEGEEYVLEKIKELYLDGKNSKQIAQQINAEKILSRYGKDSTIYNEDFGARRIYKTKKAS